MLFINSFKSAEDYNPALLNKPQLAYVNESKSIHCLSLPKDPLVEMVDLELPSGTLWAASNVGASCLDTSVSWYGNYYAWGETTPKNDYSWTTYKYCNGTLSALTKYNNDESKGIVDNKDKLEQDDDAAYINQYVYIPSAEQVDELLDDANTVKEWKKNYNDIENLNGMLFISTRNSEKIFIPAAGVINGTKIGSLTGCFIWINSVYPSNCQSAVVQSFTESKNVRSQLARCYGFSIRGVR